MTFRSSRTFPGQEFVGVINWQYSVRLLPTLDRLARIEGMIKHYRLAKDRLLKRRAVTLWRRVEAQQALIDLEKPPERVH